MPRGRGRRAPARREPSPSPDLDSDSDGSGDDSGPEEPAPKKSKRASSRKTKAEAVDPRSDSSDDDDEDRARPVRDAQVVVDGVVRHGIKFGKLRITTSRALGPNGERLNPQQRQRLFKLGSYLRYLDRAAVSGAGVEDDRSDPQKAAKFRCRDHRELPVHFLEARDKLALGVLNNEWFRSHGHVESLMKREIGEFKCVNSLSSFDRRVTAIIWHPTAPHVGIVGDKWGNLKMWNTKEGVESVQAVGKGAGDAIYGLKYDPRDGSVIGLPWSGPNQCRSTPHEVNFYAAGVSGMVMKHRLTPEGDLSAECLYFTGNPHQTWLTCLEVDPSGSCVWAGDNKGYMIQVDPRSRASEERPVFKLHKTKISCVQTAPRNPWMLATGSLDATVKIWDIRVLSQKSSDNRPIHTLMHDKSLGGLAFSRMDGNRLLTTDQHSQLRVYSADQFSLERIIPHPHRHFQHLTSMQASWHPLCDLIVVGCYPDPNLPVRQGKKGDVEFYSARTGELVGSIEDPHTQGIVSLTEFNADGSKLMLGQGMNAKVYGLRPFGARAVTRKGNDFDDDDDDHRRRRPSNDDDSDDDGPKSAPRRGKNAKKAEKGKKMSVRSKRTTKGK